MKLHSPKYHSSLSTTYLEKHNLIVDLGAREHKKTERASHIFFSFSVPFKSAKSNLKSDKFFTNKFEFLIALF